MTEQSAQDGSMAGRMMPTAQGVEKIKDFTPDPWSLCRAAVGFEGPPGSPRH